MHTCLNIWWAVQYWCIVDIENNSLCRFCVKKMQVRNNLLLLQYMFWNHYSGWKKRCICLFHRMINLSIADCLCGFFGDHPVPRYKKQTEITRFSYRNWGFGPAQDHKLFSKPIKFQNKLEFFKSVVDGFQTIFVKPLKILLARAFFYDSLVLWTFSVLI